MITNTAQDTYDIATVDTIYIDIKIIRENTIMHVRACICSASTKVLLDPGRVCATVVTAGCYHWCAHPLLVITS